MASPQTPQMTSPLQGFFAAKGRPQFNPLISHLPDAEAAFRLGRFSADAEKLANAIWPGPLTIVVERRADCPVSLLCSAGNEQHRAACTQSPGGAGAVARSGATAGCTLRQPFRTDQPHHGSTCAGGLGRCCRHDPRWRRLCCRRRVHCCTLCRRWRDIAACRGGVTRDQIEAILGHTLQTPQAHQGFSFSRDDGKPLCAPSGFAIECTVTGIR